MKYKLHTIKLTQNVGEIDCRCRKSGKISAMDESLQLISVFATTTTIHGWAWYNQTENKGTWLENIQNFPNLILTEFLLVLVYSSH